MPKLVFRVDADTSPVKKFRTEIEQVEKTMIRIKGENFSFNHWLKEFDRLKTELEKKKEQIASIKKELLSINPISNPKATSSLEKEYAQAKKDQESLVHETVNLSNKFGKAYDDLVVTLEKAQKVTDGVTAKLIEQKRAVANLQSEVRVLNVEYKNADKDKKADILIQKTSKTKELEQERVTLNALRAEQERAKLAVKGLSDETRNYEKVVGKVYGAQAEAKLVMGRFESTLLKIGGLATLQRFASDVIRVRGEFQKTQVAFETMLGSKEKADSLMSQMVETAAKTPFDLQGVADGAKQLLAYGTEAKNVNDTLVRLGNIASGLSIPLGDMVYLYGTTQTQGRLFTQDVRQFMGRGIPLVKELASMLGKTEEEINKMVTAGEIGFPQVEAVIKKMTDEGGKFYNLMEKQSQTLSGQISNLGDAWDGMLNSIGEDSQGLSSATISMATSVVSNYEEVGRILLGIIVTYGTYKAAIIALSITEKIRYQATLAQMAGMTKMQAITDILRAKTALLNKTMLANPYVMVATLAVGAAAAIWAFADHTTTAEKAQKRFNDSLVSQKQHLDDLKRSADELIGVIKSETATQYDKMDSYLKLQKIFPEVFKNMDIEKIKLMDLVTYERLLAEARNRREVVGAKTNLVLKTNAYNEAKTKYSNTSSKNSNILSYYAQMKAAEEDMKLAQKQVDDIERIRQEAKEKNKPVRVKLLEAKNNRDQILQEFLSAKMTLEEEQRKIKESGFGIIPIDVQIRFDNAKKALSNIDGIIKGLLSGKSDVTYKEAYETAKNEWKAAQKALEESKKKSKEDYDKAKKDLEEKEKAYKDLGGITGSALTKQESDAEKLRKEQEKYSLLMNKQALDRQRQEQDQETAVAQSRINAMEEGSEKTIAQMKLDHQKEIETLKRNREDYLQKKIDAERSLYESNPKNKGKSFDSSKVSLSKDEEGMFKIMLKSTITKQGNDISSYYKDLLSKYQSYAEKRLTIQKKFQKERNSLIKAGASQGTLSEHDFQRDETLQSIDNEFAMREDSFKAWADNIADLSLEKLRELLVQAEQELQRSEFLNPNDPKLAGQRAKVTSLKNTISEKSEKTNTSPDKRSQKEWQKLYRTLSKIENEFNEIGKTVGGTVGEIISAAGTITTSTLQMIDGITALSNNSSEAMSETAEAAGKSIQSVEKASVILAIISAALQITMKMLDLFGGDDTTEKYEKTKEAYESYINILDKVIDKQLELAKSLSGDNADAAYKKAIELIKTQSEAARVLGKQYLDSGASWKSHSKGYEEVDDMSWEGWSQAAQSLGMSVSQFKNYVGGRMTGLFDLTDEQLAKLSENAPIFWAQLDSDTQKYANQVVDGVSKVAEVIEQKMQDITLIDVDTLRSDFQDLLTDMDSGTEDFAGNFEKYMRNAILNSLLKESYMNRLTEWRKKFYAAMGDGMTEDEYRDLKAEGQQISDEMKAQRDAMANMFGWESETSSQEASSKGFQTMSQDTGEELNGRFTALQIAGEEIKNQSVAQTQTLNLLTMKSEDILRVNSEIRNIADDTRDLIANSYLELVQISENTGAIIKPIQQMQKDMAEVKKNTSKL